MTSRLNPYLSFKNNAKEAMAFYHSIFGGELTSSTFGEGGMSQDPKEKDLLMHSQIVGPSGYWLMGSDSPASMGEPRPNGAISLSGDQASEAELRGYWDKLSEGGTVMMPLEKAPWGD